MIHAIPSYHVTFKYFDPNSLDPNINNREILIYLKVTADSVHKVIQTISSIEPYNKMYLCGINIDPQTTENEQAFNELLRSQYNFAEQQ